MWERWAAFLLCLPAVFAELFVAPCDCCHDGATFLQSRSSRSHETLGVENSQKASSLGSLSSQTCKVTDLNNGTCTGDFVCIDCKLDASNSTLPTDAQRFPEGRLLCQGDDTCSQLAESDPIEFRDPSQVMVCIGTRTCQDVWKVTNVGAACCSSSTDEGQACYNSTFELARSAPLCQNDMCCDGNQVCSNSRLTGIESLLCKGYLACSESTLSLERDLYCNETSDANPSSSTSGGTCSDSSFSFIGGSQHVIDCLGNVCDNSNFTFEVNSNSAMLCDSDARTGGGSGGSGGACSQVNLTLAPDACLALNCTQDVDCLGLTVTLNGGQCFFLGNTTDPNYVDDCKATNESLGGIYILFQIQI